MSRESIEKLVDLTVLGLPDRKNCIARSIDDKTRGVFGLSYIDHVPAMLRGRQRFSALQSRCRIQKLDTFSGTPLSFA